MTLLGEGKEADPATGGGRGALLLRGVGKYTPDRVCRAIVGRLTRS